MIVMYIQGALNNTNSSRIYVNTQLYPEIYIHIIMAHFHTSKAHQLNNIDSKH